MHYDFKKKLNKIDSQQYRNLLIPEIDWILNEAQNVFVDIVAQPRIPSYLGFEKTQKSIDDIRTLVVPNYCSEVSKQEDNDSLGNILGNPYYLLELPEDYRYFARGRVYLNKGICKNKQAKIFIRQHDDEFEESPFDNSSFEWRNVNATFYGNFLKLYTDGTFSISNGCITYIKNPILIHNAEDFRNGSYKLPSGEVLTGTSDCELPPHTHREIVDIAVMLASSEIEAPNYQIKYSKLGLNNLK